MCRQCTGPLRSRARRRFLGATETTRWPTWTAIDLRAVELTRVAPVLDSYRLQEPDCPRVQVKPGMPSRPRLGRTARPRATTGPTTTTTTTGTTTTTSTTTTTVCDERRLRIVEHDRILLVEPARLLVDLRPNRLDAERKDLVAQLAAVRVEHLPFPDDQVDELRGRPLEFRAGRDQDGPLGLATRDVAGVASAEERVEAVPPT